jgi:hypothetical protein
MTVTVWGLLIVMTPLALVGVATAGSQLTPLNVSHVDMAFQLPLAADR